MNRSCIRVPKEEGERVRIKLMAEGLLDIGRKIGCENGFLKIPILTDKHDEFEVVYADLEILEQAPNDYKDLLDLPDELKTDLPTSFDIIGDVAIVKLPDQLLPYKNKVGEAMIVVNPSIRTVMLDSGVKGDMRIRELEQVAGTGTSETIHKEFGVRMFTDPSKVYFNPRLATERARIAAMVKDGETIIDMFAGTAPFGLIISRKANPKIIYSIDINPEAEAFVIRNMKLNHIDNIVPVTGDASEAVAGLPEADRIIMNLPQTSDRFLYQGLSKVKIGGTIHMHKILERGDVELFAEKIRKNAASEGYGIKIENVSEMKTYSPSMSVYVFDIVRES